MENIDLEAPDDSEELTSASARIYLEKLTQLSHDTVDLVLMICNEQIATDIAAMREGIASDAAEVVTRNDGRVTRLMKVIQHINLREWQDAGKLCLEYSKAYIGEMNFWSSLDYPIYMYLGALPESQDHIASIIAYAANLDTRVLLCAEEISESISEFVILLGGRRKGFITESIEVKVFQAAREISKNGRDLK